MYSELLHVTVEKAVRYNFEITYGGDDNGERPSLRLLAFSGYECESTNPEYRRFRVSMIYAHVDDLNLWHASGWRPGESLSVKPELDSPIHDLPWIEVRRDNILSFAYTGPELDLSRP